MGCVRWDEGARDRPSEQLGGASLEEDQAHDHSKKQRQEAPPPCLAGSLLIFFYFGIVFFLPLIVDACTCM